ncbi:hypothetical protein D3C73_1188730 [compost metagenome]
MKVRTNWLRSGCCAGRSIASASCTRKPTRSRNACARGVATKPRPARTSNGSPVVSRSRASARLMAEGLSRRRFAARATLPSVSSTFSVTSKLKSGVDIVRPLKVRWRWTHE